MEKNTPQDERLVDLADAFMNRRRGILPQNRSVTLNPPPADAPPPSEIEEEAPPRATATIQPFTLVDSEPQQQVLPTLDPPLPILSDVVSVPEVREDNLVSGVDPAVLKILVSEVSRNIGRHLTSELSGLLYNASLATLEADLRRGILAATEVAARNFIAQRLRLSSQQRKH